MQVTVQDISYLILCRVLQHAADLWQTFNTANEIPRSSVSHSTLEQEGSFGHLISQTPVY